jgi:hypothetical protein
VLEKDGISVAALVDIDVFEDYLEVNNPQTRKIIAGSQGGYKKGKIHSANNLLRELKKEGGSRATKVRKTFVK